MLGRSVARRKVGSQETAGDLLRDWRTHGLLRIWRVLQWVAVKCVVVVCSHASPDGYRNQQRLCDLHTVAARVVSNAIARHRFRVWNRCWTFLGSGGSFCCGPPYWTLQQHGNRRSRDRLDLSDWSAAYSLCQGNKGLVPGLTMVPWSKSGPSAWEYPQDECIIFPIVPGHPRTYAQCVGRLLNQGWFSPNLCRGVA